MPLCSGLATEASGPSTGAVILSHVQSAAMFWHWEHTLHCTKAVGYALPAALPNSLPAWLFVSNSCLL